jgi:multiple sugar transport system permease protein
MAGAAARATHSAGNHITERQDLMRERQLREAAIQEVGDEAVGPSCQRSGRYGAIARTIARRMPFEVALALPAQLTVLAVVLVPTLVVLWLSVTSWQPTQGIPWYKAEVVWLSNFVDLVQDADFVSAVLRTVFIVVLSAAVELFLAIGLALLFMEDWAWRRLAVSAIIIPMMIVPVDAANAFYMLFNDQGPLNYILSLLIGRTVQIDWLGDVHLALVPIILCEIWQWTPLMFLLMLTGLMNLPENQIRAAAVLGASPRRVFMRVILPLLMPVILLSLIVRSIEIFKLFDPVYIMTQGGPGNATETISMYMYHGAFMFFRMGYMAAAALMVLVVVITISAMLARPLMRH